MEDISIMVKMIIQTQVEITEENATVAKKNAIKNAVAGLGTVEYCYISYKFED